MSEAELADAAQLASLADETPEGRSIVVLAKEKYGLRGRETCDRCDATFMPFSAQTRMSGVDLDGREIRKGAPDAIVKYACKSGATRAAGNRWRRWSAISNAGGTPLLVAENGRVLGVIYLKDIVKGGMRERFDQLRAMGIRTVMITGDNPLTAAAIAREAGVDDFLAEAKPEDKMALIRARTGQGETGRDDGRRHERRAGSGAGGRGRGDEHRHASGERSRQHGGSRFQSDETD